MRHALTVLTDELRRLKSSGVKSIVVSDESVAALRRVVEKRRATQGATAATTESLVAEAPSSSGEVITLRPEPARESQERSKPAEKAEGSAGG